LVAYPVAVAGNLEGRHRVEVARRQTAQTAVPEAGIRLHLLDLLEIVPERMKRLLDGVRKVQVDYRIAERPSHEELERQVVDTLGVLIRIPLLRRRPALRQAIANRPGGAHVEV